MSNARSNKDKQIREFLSQVENNDTIRPLPNYVYRDFNIKENHMDDPDPHKDYFKASIECYLLRGNKLLLQVVGLQENGSPYDYIIDYPSGQADVLVEYPEGADLYNTILTVLDKITADHQYFLGDTIYKDFIECNIKCLKENPDLCYFDSGINHFQWPRMDFTEATTQYLEYDADFVESENTITIHGEVSVDGTFTYDYPIISRGMDREYYRLTRGKIVWDVKYDHQNNKYIAGNLRFPCYPSLRV